MSSLVDTGPLIALIDRGQGETYRKRSDVLKTVSEPFVTTWPCFTEAMYFLRALKGWHGQESLWGFVERGGLRIHSSTALETNRMRALMEKYVDTPMDLADASLVAAAETLGLRSIFTLDADFHVYRINGTTAFEVIPAT